MELFLYYTLRHNELSTDNGQTFDTMESFKEAKFHTSQVKNDWLNSTKNVQSQLRYSMSINTSNASLAPIN